MFKARFTSLDDRFSSGFKQDSSSLQTNFDEYKVIQGEDGFSPIVEVEELENGYQVTITDKNGPAVFVIENGAKGVDVREIYFNDESELIFVMSDGSIKNVGKVVGETDIDVSEIIAYINKEIEAVANSKQDNLAFDGIYNTENNKVATVDTVTKKVAEIVANAPEDFNTLKEMSDWLAEHENTAAEMNSDIKTNTNDIAGIKEDLLTNYTKNTNIASHSTAGLIKLGAGMIISNDSLYFFTPTDNDFKKTTRPADHLKVSNTDQIVKFGLTDCRIDWSEDTKDENNNIIKGDKTKARELLGAVGFSDYAKADQAGVIKVVGSAPFHTYNGELRATYAGNYEIKTRQRSFIVNPSNLEFFIKAGLTGLKLVNGVDTYEQHDSQLTDVEKTAAQRWLGIDTLVGDIESALDELHTYAQNLISGGES